LIYGANLGGAMVARNNNKTGREEEDAYQMLQEL
jgi:hypothetical protein